MLYYFKIFAISLSGAVFSSMIFYLWIGLFWYVYEKFYGPYHIGDLFLFVFYVKNPFLYALIPGILLGIFQGFLTGLIIGVSKTTNIIYSGIIGYLVTIIVLLTAISILSLLDEPNPIGLIFQFVMFVIYDFRVVLQFLLFFLFPSIIIGFAVVKIKNLFLG